MGRPHASPPPPRPPPKKNNNPKNAPTSRRARCAAGPTACSLTTTTTHIQYTHKKKPIKKYTRISQGQVFSWVDRMLVAGARAGGGRNGGSAAWGPPKTAVARSALHYLLLVCAIEFHD